ncbi:MAG: ABC transporter ATP-binding protein [Salibacteraceae bacterium]
MIEVRNIHKSFGDKEVLHDISMVLEKGKANLIIGASGSGKTTLVKCMVGLHEASQGEILYNDRSFTQMKDRDRTQIRKEIGFLFQASALFDSMTVEENVMFPLTMFTDQSKEERLERANFCLERVGLQNANKLFPSELSGGMKKRVGIARAIALKPSYLFCDEPNSGLDPLTSILIDNLIKEITEEFGITTVVITHDMNSVLEIGDKVFFLWQGQNWWQGSRQDILQTDNKELIDFVYASEFMKMIRKKGQ